MDEPTSPLKSTPDKEAIRREQERIQRGREIKSDPLIIEIKDHEYIFENKLREFVSRQKENEAEQTKLTEEE